MNKSDTRAKSIGSGPAHDGEESGLDRRDNVLVALRDMYDRLHCVIHEFTPDPEFLALANEKIPEAMNGLDFVMQKTSDAANRTLDLVEQSSPLAAELQTRAQSLDTQWHEARQHDPASEQHTALAKNLTSFLTDVGTMSGALRANLSEILLAQEFQDLTGQVIQRVMNDVKVIEDQLRDLTEPGARSARTVGEVRTKTVEALGPVTEPTKEGRAIEQNEADDILGELDL